MSDTHDPTEKMSPQPYTTAPSHMFQRMCRSIDALMRDREVNVLLVDAVARAIKFADGFCEFSFDGSHPPGYLNYPHALSSGKDDDKWVAHYVCAYCGYVYQVTWLCRRFSNRLEEVRTVER